MAASPAPTVLSDAALVRRAASGERDAFAALYQRHQAQVYRFARMMSGDRAIAEEVTQDVFLTLLGALPRYRPERAALTTYLYGIARNVTRNRMRRERRFAGGEPPPGREPIAPDDPAAALAAAHDLRRLRRAIAALPSRYREVVILAHLHGLPYAEIAAVIAAPVGTVRSRLSRARELLAAQLAPEMREAV